MNTYLDIYLENIKPGKNFQYTSGDPKLELYEILRKHLGPVADSPHQITGKEAIVMVAIELERYTKLAPTVLATPNRYLWSSYDAEADVLYINFKKPSVATDSELTDDDVIIRYENEEVIGLTVLHASKR